MRYHIYVGDNKIASFTDKHDRDICIDALELKHLECIFTPKDD